MMEIRYLREEEKLRSRPLCEECFPEDSKEFTDYYYAEKCRDNRILAAADEAGRIVSMVHANPFAVSLFGKGLTVQYVVAVATAAGQRRQGLMRRLMEQTLRDCCARGEAFSFLMPANPAYYESLGYRYWQNQREWILPETERRRLADYLSDRSRFPAEMLADPGFSCLSDHPQAAAEAAEFANRILDTQFDLYVIRDAAYYERLMKEQASEFGDVILVRKERFGGGQGPVCGCVCYSREGKLEFREPIFAGELCEERRPLMMGRIVSLEKFAGSLRFPEPYVDVIRVEDAVIPENNGVFRIEIDETGGRAARVPDKKARRTMDIAELGQVLFDKIRIFINELV